MLNRYRFALAAFLIPLGARFIPEVLSWPYPIGFDTVIYIQTMQDGWSIASTGLVNFLHYTNLFYLLSSTFYGLTNNAILLMKILGPVMMGILCFLMYLYARRGLGWSNWKSLLVAILVGVYFVSLRNSWDMYRQTLGLIFLMATLISLKTPRSPRKYCAAALFMVLTVLSHELATVVLFFFLLLEGARMLHKKANHDFALLSASAVLPVALFMFQRFSLTTGAFGVPAPSVASEPSLSLALYIGGSLVYCYAFIIPFVVVGLFGLKDLFVRAWVLLGLTVVMLLMVDPNLPLYLWFRWVLLLVYPLLFLATDGIDRLWRFSQKYNQKIKRLIPKIVVLAYLISLFTLSGYFVTSSPEHAFPYFYQYNNYLSVIPSSMQQNSISIQDTASLVDCFEWVNQNVPQTSVFVVHDAFYYLTSTYIHNREVVFFKTDVSLWSNMPDGAVTANQMLRASQDAHDTGHAVYSFWWVSGKGWYAIPSLPSAFVEVYRSGNMVVYSFRP
jgi:hypothetical protein